MCKVPWKKEAGRSHYQLAAVLHVFPEPVK
jgi:hypothetical protein